MHVYCIYMPFARFKVIARSDAQINEVASVFNSTRLCGSFDRPDSLTGANPTARRSLRLPPTQRRHSPVREDSSSMLQWALLTSSMHCNSFSRRCNSSTGFQDSRGVVFLPESIGLMLSRLQRNPHNLRRAHLGVKRAHGKDPSLGDPICYFSFCGDVVRFAGE